MAGPSKPRDDRPGMFTPPTFHLLSQSQETDSKNDDMNVDYSPDRVVCENHPLTSIASDIIPFNPEQGM